MNRRKLGLTVLLLALLVAAGPFYALAADNSKPEQAIPAVESASIASKTYVETFIGDDGNANKGSNTSFSQQARALLITAATADRARFESVWSRTKTDFARPGGGYDASTPDLLMVTRAFLVAAQRIEDPKYNNTAQQLASEISLDPRNNVDASLMQLRTLDELASLSGSDAPGSDAQWPSNAQWATAAEELRKLQTGQLVQHKLLADSVVPAGNIYGPKAQFATLMLKDSCVSSDVITAKTMWKTLRLSPDLRLANAVDVEGGKEDASPSVQAAIATAAAAAAAGEHVQSLELLDKAAALASASNTAEALSWAAIGRIVISTDWFGTCY